MKFAAALSVLLVLGACAGQTTPTADVEIGIGTGGASGSGAVGIRRGNVGVVVGR